MRLSGHICLEPDMLLRLVAEVMHLHRDKKPTRTRSVCLDGVDGIRFGPHRCPIRRSDIYVPSESFRDNTVRLFDTTGRRAE